MMPRRMRPAHSANCLGSPFAGLHDLVSAQIPHARKYRPYGGVPYIILRVISWVGREEKKAMMTLGMCMLRFLVPLS